MNTAALTQINISILPEIKGQAIVKLSTGTTSVQKVVNKKLFESCKAYRSDILELLYCEAKEMELNQ